MKEPKFFKAFEKYSVASKKLHKESKDYIKDTLLGLPNNYLAFHTYDEDGIREDDNYITVGYLVCHPEYDSELRAEVDGIHWDKRGCIKLELAEHGDYDIDYITTDELYTVAETMYNILNT